MTRVRILVTSFPAYGHFHPVAPLALALQAARHEVRVATGPNLVDWALRCGLPASAVGLPLDVAEATAARDHAGPAATGHLFTDVWVGSALPGLLELTGRWRPDLVVHEEQEYAGVLLAALLGVPCVTQSWSAPARALAGRQAQEAMLAPIWERHLPGSTPRRVGELYLDGCPPAFQTDDVLDIGRTTLVRPVRPTTYDGPPAEAPHLVRDLARPAAYVTLGTVPTFSTPELLHAVATAVAPVVDSVVVTTGPNPVESLGDLPPNVRAVGYLPQSSLLPAVDLVVSHGGAGGTLGALEHGLPHLVLAGRGMSQRSIAAAVDRLGVGISLDHEHRDRVSIAAACQRLLGEPSFATAARALARELDDLPGPAELVGLVESVAA